MGKDFQAKESKIPKKKKTQMLGDSDVMKIVEDVCDQKKFGGSVSIKNSILFLNIERLADA